MHGIKLTMDMIVYLKRQRMVLFLLKYLSIQSHFLVI